MAAGPNGAASREVWVLVDIGCIECGHENEAPIIGVFDNEKSALKALRHERETLQHNYIDENHRRGFDHVWVKDRPNGFDISDGQTRLIRFTVGQFNSTPLYDHQLDHEKPIPPRPTAEPDPFIMDLIRERFSGKPSDRRRRL